MPTAPAMKPGPLDIEVGKILKRYMAGEDITKTKVALDTGISRSMVSEMLNGHKPMNLNALDLMCRSVGLMFREVVLEADETTRARRLT
jgi:transcriptional regulator with XRE-family HTH domain